MPGKDAESFGFTSAIAVQLLKVLKPELEPLIEEARRSADAGRLVPPETAGGSDRRACERDYPARIQRVARATRVHVENAAAEQPQPGRQINRQELERLGR